MRRAVLGLVAIGFIFVGADAAAQPSRGETAHARLDRVIDLAIHGEGPFLLPRERALVERKCGYAPGTWDGNNFSMDDGVLRCSNGRRVDDPEVRAMMAEAGPRISRRVNAAMARPEVRAAIAAVAEEASREALARLSGERRDD